MFPTIYHFLEYLLGISLPFLKVVNTFGFFVAMSIAAAYWAMSKELQRLSLAGRLKTWQVEITTGKPFEKSYYFSQAFFGFIFGYKVIYLLIETQNGKNPQDLIFNLNGSILYGFLAVVALLGFTFYTDKKQQKGGIQVNTSRADASMHMGTITTVALLSGFVGAKLFHILENFNSFNKEYILDNLLSTGGWTFFGGLICGAAGVLIYCNRQGYSIWSILDSGAAAMMLSYGIGRFGCHFSGDGDWGVANFANKPFPMPNWLWSYTYPNNVLGMDGFSHEGMKPIPNCTGDFCYELISPVWPTPLYEALMALGLFAILWFILRKKNLPPGNLFAYYMVFAGVERFAIEIIREHGDSLYTIGSLAFSQAQMISMLLFVLGLAWLLINRKGKLISA